MNDTIAQMVALTCYGNASLAGYDAGSFFPDHPTVAFCERVEFVQVARAADGRNAEQRVADTPQAWFGWLREQRLKGLRLGHAAQNQQDFPDRLSAGLVGGGGMWAVEAVGPDGASAYWLGRWEGGNEQAPDRRVWRVTYGEVARQPTPPFSAPDLPACRRRLLDSLEAIRTFAEEYECAGFALAFAEARRTLETPEGGSATADPALAPAGFLSPEAVTLLAACQHAWVFGAMGSWNDLAFDGAAGEEYEKVSEALFQALTAAIANAASDSYYHRPPPR